MANKQIATRVDAEQDRRFREITRAIGTTPSDALRMFIAAFNAAGGFPYTPRVGQSVDVEAFDSEEDAARFASDLARKLVDAQANAQG